MTVLKAKLFFKIDVGNEKTEVIHINSYHFLFSIKIQNYAFHIFLTSN